MGRTPETDRSLGMYIVLEIGRTLEMGRARWKDRALGHGMAPGDCKIVTERTVAVETRFESGS